VRLLVDENVPLDSVRALRSAGHDVFSASEAAPGETDTNHLERSIREDRLIVTFDRDFGELVTRGLQRPPAGVLLLRIVPKSALEVTELLLALLARKDMTWRNHLSVVDHAHIRQRRL
jgi:predicted nuclease of predicted toxin-antitoxin system